VSAGTGPTADESARAVADAVLYEGYVLYPYRASSPKNQVRWQWGVLMPADVTAQDPSERSGAHTEVLVDGRAGEVTLTVRFLQVQRRTVERAAGAGFEPVPRLDVGDASYTAWDEATTVERELPVPETKATVRLEIEGGTDVEELRDGSGTVVGRLVRTREALRVGVTTSVERPESPYAVRVLSVTLDNLTPAPDQGTDDRAGADRPRWLRRALVAAHLLLRVDGARFLSRLDPPHWASALAAARRHEGLFPVLGGPEGDASVLLASPIILYDHATLAPESESSFFDALEVDELLSLRTMTLSDDEKREMRGTDPRAAALLGEVDAMPPELWDRLHGTVRHLDRMSGGPPASPERAELPPLETPWWDPGSDASVDPEHDTVRIGDTDVRRGHRVILRPGVRRADAYDLFLAGRTATVAAVLLDVDQGTHLAVTVDDDPGSDLKDAHGRYLYFAPDEVEPLTGAHPS
jgi:hypothetical protein